MYVWDGLLIAVAFLLCCTAGGSAVRVSATSADGDRLGSHHSSLASYRVFDRPFIFTHIHKLSAALIKFDIVSCAFRGNTGQVGAMVGAAVLLVGTGATEVAAMAAKPSLDSVSFIENVAQTGASGFHYEVADATALVKDVSDRVVVLLLYLRVCCRCVAFC